MIITTTTTTATTTTRITPQESTFTLPDLPSQQKNYSTVELAHLF